MFLERFVDLGAGLGVELGGEDAQAFGKLDHLADVEVDALVLLVGLKFISQRLVYFYSSFVVS